MYYLGVNKSEWVDVTELRAHGFGTMLCRVTMSRRRFEFISCRIRFDDKNTPVKRRAADVLASIREIWEIFVLNCQNNYQPSEFLTIDVQLLGFRGRFSARVYIKSKPARYGIKIVSMNDDKTFYMANAIPYIGQVSVDRGESVPTYYVRKLSEPIHDTPRNITRDNWFTSIELFNKMKKNHGLTMVGTIRKNKREIPQSFKCNSSIGTTRYGYDGDNILLFSLSKKKNKVVLMLSSKHKTGKQCADSDKPEMITFYNETKYGTDVFDQLFVNYTCVQRSNRWPMHFFWGMIDQTGVN